MSICSRCGTLQTGEAFCHECGQRVTAEPPPLPPARPVVRPPPLPYAGSGPPSTNRDFGPRNRKLPYWILGGLATLLVVILSVLMTPTTPSTPTDQTASPDVTPRDTAKSDIDVLRETAVSGCSLDSSSDINGASDWIKTVSQR